jgi:hypothetical protein
MTGADPAILQPLTFDMKIKRFGSSSGFLLRRRKLPALAPPPAQD